MTKYFSYLDTALQVIHINVESQLNDEQHVAFKGFLEESETSRHARSELLSQHLKQHLQSDPELKRKITHETIHYLQAIYYPFLYYINWLEYHNLMQLRESLKRSDLESVVLNEIRMTPQLANNYRLTSIKFQFYWNNNQLMLGGLAEPISLNAFCMQDLLESVTTIFDYKIANTDYSSSGYERWINNPANKGYKNLYKFIATKFGRDFAYDLLPVLVQIAFHTTEPLSAFCHAVSYIAIIINDHTILPVEQYPPLILAWLEEKLGLVTPDPEKDLIIQELKVGVIRHEQLHRVAEYSQYNEISLHYPQSFHFKKFLGETNEDIKSFLIHADIANFDAVTEKYFPFAIHYYFLDFGGRNSTLFISPEYLNRVTPDKLDYATYAKEMMKFKESTMALFSNTVTEAPHNCHHVTCGYYETNLCRKWNAIPKVSDTCGFPSWFTWFYYRKIDLKQGLLKKVEKVEADLNWEIYWSQSHKKRGFEYLEKNGIYILTISKSDIEKGEAKPFLENLIRHLTKEKGLKGEQLFGVLSFDFFEYNTDPRELFEIPEVCKWFRKLKSDYPELFCLLDMEQHYHLRTVLLPILVKYEKVSSNAEGFLIKFDEKELEQFLLHEGTIFMQFMLKHRITDLSKPTKNFTILAHGI